MRYRLGPNRFNDIVDFGNWESMNQVYINCQELQRFLERQWQKIRGILSQDAEVCQERQPLQDDGWDSEPPSSSELQISSDNAEHPPSDIRK